MSKVDPIGHIEFPNLNGNPYKRVEVKYCERCGGLFTRDSGSGVVYCPDHRGEIELVEA